MSKSERRFSMNRQVVGQASRLPLGRLAPQLFAGETPAKTAGTAAPLRTGKGSWSQCMRRNETGLPMNLASETRLRSRPRHPTQSGIFEDEQDDENEDEPVHGPHKSARARG